MIPTGLRSRRSRGREIRREACICHPWKHICNPRHAFHHASCPAASIEKMVIPQRPFEQGLHGFQWAMTLVWLSLYRGIDGSESPCPLVLAKDSEISNILLYSALTNVFAVFIEKR